MKLTIDVPKGKKAVVTFVEDTKRTGYERADTYYTQCCEGYVHGFPDSHETNEYDCANYYSDPDLAESNARADTLMRQLRRFAAEHGGIPTLDKRKAARWLCDVCYDHANGLHADVWTTRHAGEVLFNSKEACEQAIKDYYDELMWYFTEYEPRRC